MKIIQSRRFEKAVKKLHANQKKDLDKAIKEIVSDPYIGQEKSGDLAGIRVHKFSMVKQLVLIAYTYDNDTFILNMFGVHENFYRDLKH